MIASMKRRDAHTEATRRALLREARRPRGYPPVPTLYNRGILHEPASSIDDRAVVSAEARDPATASMFRDIRNGDPEATARLARLVGLVVNDRGYAIPHGDRPDVIRRAGLHPTAPTHRSTGPQRSQPFAAKQTDEPVCSTDE